MRSSRIVYLLIGGFGILCFLFIPIRFLFPYEDMNFVGWPFVLGSISLAIFIMWSIIRMVQKDMAKEKSRNKARPRSASATPVIKPTEVKIVFWTNRREEADEIVTLTNRREEAQEMHFLTNDRKKAQKIVFVTNRKQEAQKVVMLTNRI